MPNILDRVSISLKGEETRIVESYEVQMAVMTQPSRFSLRLGHAGITKSLLDRYPPGTDFTLFVDGQGGDPHQQFLGRIDARAAGGASTTVTLRGRDSLASLYGVMAKADKAYKNMTYFSLVEAVMVDAGITDWTLFDSTIQDKKTKTGSSKVPNAASARETGFKDRTRKTIVHPPQIRAGERYYEFLKRILDRAGMFLYATADGSFVLTEPDPTQAPLYRIVNLVTPDPGKGSSNVEDFEFSDDTTERFSEAVIYGRGGGSFAGRAKAKGDFFDDEMSAFGIHRPCAFVDVGVSSPDEAKFFARRKIAETRRSGWSLTYTLPGHTTPPIGGGNSRICWARDTMVDVQDEQLGIFGPHYIESVVLTGTADATFTTVRLMRPKDLVFGESD